MYVWVVRSEVCHVGCKDWGVGTYVRGVRCGCVRCGCEGCECVGVRPEMCGLMGGVKGAGKRLCGVRVCECVGL